MATARKGQFLEKLVDEEPCTSKPEQRLMDQTCAPRRGGGGTERDSNENP